MLTVLPKLFSLAKYLPVIILLAGSAYGMHMFIVNNLKDEIRSLENNVTILSQRAEVLENITQANENTITSLRNRLQQQAEQVVDLTASRQQLIRERDEYLSIFRRHDLTRLSRARPGLIQPRINSGTADVFRQIEQDSRELHHAQHTDSNNPPDTP